MSTREAAERMARRTPAALYRERLLPPAWIWILAMVFIGSLAVAVGASLGIVAGVTSLVVIGLVTVWWLLASSPAILVTEGELRVGRAHIGWEYVGLVATLDAASTRAARGTGADPRAFTVMRSLTAPESVTIEICDDSDPHPYWLVSTRHPDVLGEQIRIARQTALAKRAQGPQ